MYHIGKQNVCTEISIISAIWSLVRPIDAAETLLRRSLYSSTLTLYSYCSISGEHCPGQGGCPNSSPAPRHVGMHSSRISFHPSGQ